MNTTGPSKRPRSYFLRGAASLSCMGLAPLLLLLPVMRRNSAVIREGSVLFLSLALVLAIGLVVFHLFANWVVHNQDSVSVDLVKATDWVLGIFLLMLGIYALGGMMAMICDWKIRISLFSTHPLLVKAGFFLSVAMIAGVTTLPFLSWRANQLMTDLAENKAVYFLYDEKIPVPKWAYALASIRISSITKKRFGNDQFVMCPIDPESVQTAVENGKVIIFASHGSHGTIGAYYENEYVLVSPQIENGAEGLIVETGRHEARSSQRFLSKGQLQLVYVSGCHGGKLGEHWEASLAPAKVLTFNRLSLPHEHALWLFFTAPADFRKLS